MSMNQVEILRAACCMAGLDQAVCERERPILERMAEEAGVGRASLEAMIQRAQNDPNFYREQFRVVRADPELAMNTLLRIAAADHKITLEERVIFQHFAEQLGLSVEQFGKMLDEAETEAEAEAAKGMKG